MVVVNVKVLCCPHVQVTPKGPDHDGVSIAVGTGAEEGFASRE